MLQRLPGALQVAQLGGHGLQIIEFPLENMKNPFEHAVQVCIIQIFVHCWNMFDSNWLSKLSKHYYSGSSQLNSCYMKSDWCKWYIR